MKYDLTVIYEFGLAKEVLFEQARQLAEEFCKVNDLPIIPVYEDARLRGFGVYEHDKVKVNVRSTATPLQKRGRVWSFPGHKSDRTAAGVVCHEFGHHAYFNRRLPRGWREVVQATKPITSYEPSIGEAYAETARLFILNPDLLRLGRPERYEYLTKFHGLRPVVDVSWRTVMTYAPEHILLAAEKFILGK